MKFIDDICSRNRLISLVAAFISMITLAACGGGDGYVGTIGGGNGNPVALYMTAPSSVTTAVGAAQTFAIGGGAAPYSVSSSNVNVSTATVSGTILLINGVAAGTVQIAVFDSTGKSVSTTVTVGSVNAFFVTAPSAMSMGSGTTAASSYLISGGTKPYNISSSDIRVVTGTVDSTTSALTINAWNSGTATLKISDALGANYSITVVVDNATGAVAPAAIEILASSNTLSSAPGSSVSFIVTVKDHANTAVPTQTVAFSADSGTVSGANPAPVTNAAGTISTVTLSPGTNAANRAIILTATTSGVSRTITVPVVGTNVSVTGGGAAMVGGTAKSFTVKAVDSSGKPIVGATLTVTSALLNGISPQTVTTDISGAGTVVFTALNVGNDTLTVTGLGATGTTSVMVSNVDFSFTTSAATASFWPVSTANPMTARYLVAGIPQSGFNVTFSSTRGTLSATTAITDALGEATVNVSSTTAGPVTVSAQLGTVRTSLVGAFVATVPANVVLQANPAALLPNASGSTTNQSALTAVVRDAVGNGVQGVVVNFAAIADGSNGTISPGSATTDANGLAASQFIPGSLSTAANGVQIRATALDPITNATVATSTANLTVNGEALFISIGRSNTLTAFDSVTYQKEFVVYLTDASGAPAGNRTVTLAVDPITYGKGRLKWVPPVVNDAGTVLAAGYWDYAASAIKPNAVAACVNEDTNRNGILDAGDVDLNADGRLQPGMPVAITSSVTTDALGFAPFTLRYAKTYAWWVSTQITARSLVGGTESKQTQYFDLSMSSDDGANAGSPANVVSPFGVASVCTDPS